MPDIPTRRIRSLAVNDLNVGGVDIEALPLMPGGGLPPGGSVFFLDPTRGSDTNDGLTPTHAFATLAHAYAALTANQNDILYFIPGATACVLSAMFTWGKDYTHLIGLGAPVQTGQRCRITQLSTLTGASPLVTVSANGCIISNIRINQGVNNAASLIAVSVTGQRNFFWNVDFAGGGHATQAITGGASLQLDGGAENVFDRCSIGLDTVAAATGMTAILFPATGAAARNHFRDCLINLWAGNAGAIFVKLLGNGGIDRYQLFERCQFINLGTVMTQAFSIAAGFDPANKRFLLKDCTLIGAAKWDNADLGAVYGNMNVVTGADGSGQLVQMIT